MRILLCCHLPLTLEMGASKAYLEAASAYRLNDLEVKIVGIDDIVKEVSAKLYLNENWRIENFPKYLVNYLIEHKEEYDVAEIEHLYLPERPAELENKLIVARSILLEHHFEYYKFPHRKNLRRLVSRLIKGNQEKRNLDIRIRAAKLTFSNSDLISIPNRYDRDRLIKNDIDAKKIIIQPHGLLEERREYLEQCKSNYNLDSPVFLFLGSFDYRKGCLDLVKIFERIYKVNNSAKLRLLGVKGLFQDESSILEFFPHYLHDSLEIILRFDSEKILDYLDDVTMGIFPSYVESFGYGVLEQTASKIPVLAYDVPGPCQLLPKELLSTHGDIEAIANKIEKYLEDERAYKKISNDCYNISLNYKWRETVKESITIYYERLKEK